MHLSWQAGTLVALLLGTARAAGFVLLAPPFASRTVPVPARAAFAFLLAVTALPATRTHAPDLAVGPLVTAGVTEVAIGAGLGFLVYLLFTAVQTAGDLIDVTGGFSLQPGFDPMALTMNSSIGRLHYLLATTLLFTTGGHALVVRGFLTSYQGLPVGAHLPTGELAAMVTHAISQMFLAALQIGGPMIAVLFLADVALALLSKAAPGLNVFSVGLPLKLTITVSLLALTIPLLPAAVSGLLEDATRLMVHLGGT